MKGFKDFLLRGNLIELAVAFIIGGAFATVVKSFTAIVMDLLGKLGGTPNFSSWVPGGVHVGVFLTDLIAFVVLAFVVYFGVVKPYEMAIAHRKAAKGIQEDAPEPTTEELLTEIRDLLASKN
ncbi:large conductance mechanosensitive channel protein MscL [Acidipropionibacterium timonense]|uniref:large conductance mechanosensitive channel protein MscL n=1 Tax=Acidipropionibacterium timonense TaxID=2161818 RepID=UPI001031B46D|nr:large conductance mechanosensitive channel protein MscL [Acidipropionibacterium timonense]